MGVRARAVIGAEDETIAVARVVSIDWTTARANQAQAATATTSTEMRTSVTRKSSTISGAAGVSAAAVSVVIPNWNGRDWLGPLPGGARPTRSSRPRR